MPGKHGDRGGGKGQSDAGISKEAANPYGSPFSKGSPKPSKPTSKPGVEREAPRAKPPLVDPSKPPPPQDRARHHAEKEEAPRKGVVVTKEVDPRKEGSKKEEHRKEGSKAIEHEKERSDKDGSRTEVRTKQGSKNDYQEKGASKKEVHSSKKDEGRKEGSKKEEHRKEGSKKEEHKTEGSKKEEHRKEGSKKEEHRMEGSKKEEHRTEGSKKEEHRKEGSKKEEHRKEGAKKEEHRKAGSKKDEHRKDGSKSKDKLQSGSVSSLRSDEPGAPIASAVMERERKKAAAERSKKKDKEGNLSDHSQSHIRVYEDPPMTDAMATVQEPIMAKMMEVKDDKGGDEYCYEDEKFEDYDEDFEEDEEGMEEDEREEEREGTEEEEREGEGEEEEREGGKGEGGGGEKEREEEGGRRRMEGGREMERLWKRSKEMRMKEKRREAIRVWMVRQKKWRRQGANRQLDMVEIMMAISAENLAVETRQTSLGSPGQGAGLEQGESNGELPESGSTHHHHHPHLQPSPSRAHVQFTGASKREAQQRASKRTYTRGQELLGLIELDIVAFDLFDLQPLTEYELYIKSFGMENTRQVTVQTGEDNMERDAQTDAVLCSEKWVQWPPEDFRGWGGPDVDMEDFSDVRSASSMGEGAIRLLAFLKKAGQVCSQLLEENMTSYDESKSHITHSQLPFCTNLIQFPALPGYFEAGNACDVKFSPIRDSLFVAAYTNPSVSCADPSLSGSGLPARGVVCVWDTLHPSQPHQILVCEATPTCCCFSLHKTYLVFAGNVDGSVVLWDLREPEFMHKSPSTEYSSPVPRVATFTTAGLVAPDNHSSPICTIAPLTAGATDSSLAPGAGEDSVGLSFQLATLDHSGRLNLWVKLVKNVTIETCAPIGRALSVATAERVFCMQFSPSDPNHLYVGMDTGCVHHFTRYGRRPIPKLYGSGQMEGVMCDISSVSFCPQQPDHFLSAGSDGSLRLHCITREHPLVYWPHSTGGTSVKSVQWSPSKPGLFVVLDENSVIYLWDLLQCDASPIFSQQMTSSVICCQLPYWIEASRTPGLLLALADGILELHHLKDSFSPNDSDVKQFEMYLDSLSRS
ncbi:hypothetical protein EMCRGX_G009730 [Ephydatia muelleri]